MSAAEVRENQAKLYAAQAAENAKGPSPEQVALMKKAQADDASKIAQAKQGGGYADRLSAINAQAQMQNAQRTQAPAGTAPSMTPTGPVQQGTPFGMGMKTAKAGGSVKKMAKGGAVKGGGIEIKGTRKCKIV
jgi:hypothetical protein